MNDLQNELQKAYWEFIKRRTEEYTQKCLSGRLVIDIRKGQIEQIFDQAVVAGATSLNYYSDKI